MEEQENVGSLMTAHSKLQEANFFFQLLERPEENTAETFKNYVSACVSGIYGIMQHLLYDYAQKYWAKFDTNDYVDPSSFTLLAKITQNHEASKFVEWYNKAIGRINNNPDAAAVLKTRKLETHRSDVPYSYIWELVLDGSTNISSTIVFPQPTTERTREIVVPYLSRETVTAMPPGKLTSIIPVFDHYPEKPAVEVISNTITLLKSLVDEAETNFGPVD